MESQNDHIVSNQAEKGSRFFEHAPWPKRSSALVGELEVKAMWGPIVLTARQFAADQTVCVGGDDADFQMELAGLPGMTCQLVGPSHGRGRMVQLMPGMDLEVQRDGEVQRQIDLEQLGAMRCYSLQVGDRARITCGQLSFLVQFTEEVFGVRSPRAAQWDPGYGKWIAICLVLAVGFWTAIDMTPVHLASQSDYLANPARFANLIMPKLQQREKRFEAIEKPAEEIPKSQDDKWRKATPRKVTDGAAVPRKLSREQNRKIVSETGILRWLKGAAGGSNGSGSMFDGVHSPAIDSALNDLPSNRPMGDSGFAGIIGKRGGPGGGSPGLGIGGISDGPFRPDGPGTDSIRAGHRGQSNVTFDKRRTRIVGGLPQAVVGRHMERHWNRFKYCYERQLSKEPNLYGKVLANFTIGGDGRVSEAQVVQSSLANHTVESCLLRSIRSIRFPKPRGGGEVVVTYPFLMTTAGR